MDLDLNDLDEDLHDLYLGLHQDLHDLYQDLQLELTTVVHLGLDKVSHWLWTWADLERLIYIYTYTCIF